MILTTIAGVPVEWSRGTEILSYTAGLQVDADGSPRCYHPVSAKGLDNLANSGFPSHPQQYKQILACREVGGEYLPVIQSGESLAQPFAGYFISMTSYIWSQYPEDDVRRYVDAENVPYVVIPRHVPAMIRPRVLGCLVEVALYVGDGMPERVVQAVCVDKGPKHKIGEGSVCLAGRLGINPSPRNGGTSKKVITYRFHTGVPAVLDGVTYELRAA